MRRGLTGRNLNLLIVAGLAAISVILAGSHLRAGTVTAPQRRTNRARPQKSRSVPKPKIDYSKFSHTTHAITQNLECNSCHKAPSRNWKDVRIGDAAFPDVADFPEHSACLKCHRTQFFARERPAPAICSNCHIAVTPRDTARWLFPSLGDVTNPKLLRRDAPSEFAVDFPHAKHIDVVSFNNLRPERPSFVAVSFQKKDAPPASCQVCHQTYQPQGKSSEEYVTKAPKDLGDNFWLKKGAFKTIPTSHEICFTCHNSDSGIAPEPKNCNVCHKLATPWTLKTDFDPKLASAMGITDRVMLARWSRRISAGGFRHEGGEHPDLNCLGCHKADSVGFNLIDPKSLKVPVRSCGGGDGCHVTAKSDDGGILNYEIDQKKKDPKFVCTKCHLTLGREAIPESHPQAIPTPAAKGKPSQ